MARLYIGTFYLLTLVLLDFKYHGLFKTSSVGDGGGIVDLLLKI
jgi:hypothetical protein